MSRTYINPHYTGSVEFGYDVALMRLSYAPRIDNYTRPICMGSMESFQKVLEQGTDAVCHITGNGFQDDYVLNGTVLLLQ